MRSNCNVAIVDPDCLSRQGLNYILSNHGITVTSEVDGVGELNAQRDSGERLDLILADWSALDDDPIARIGDLHTQWPECYVVVLSRRPETDALLECFRAGAHGFLLKSVNTQALIASLTMILNGERVYPSDLIGEVLRGRMSAAGAIVAPSGDDVSLSEREREILGCLVRGHSNKSIANRLHITEPTVKVHLQSLLKKLNVENRTQAAVWAVQNAPDRTIHAAALERAAERGAERRGGPRGNRGRQSTVPV